MMVQWEKSWGGGERPRSSHLAKLMTPVDLPLVHRGAPLCLDSCGYPVSLSRLILSFQAERQWGDVQDPVSNGYSETFS